MGADATMGEGEEDWDMDDWEKEWEGGEDDWDTEWDDDMGDWETEGGEGDWSGEGDEWEGKTTGPSLDIREPTEEEAMILGSNILECTIDT